MAKLLRGTAQNGASSTSMIPLSGSSSERAPLFQQGLPGHHPP
jgi:hypothetical protein